MGTYGLDGVITAWEQGKLTTEQAVGQILLLLQELEQRVKSAERRLERSGERLRRYHRTGRRDVSRPHGGDPIAIARAAREARVHVARRGAGDGADLLPVAQDHVRVRLRAVG